MYIVLRPQKDVIDARFGFRVFENRQFQMLAQSFGNGILEHRCAINWDILKGIRIAIPPLTEQKAIASFLDRATAKIDKLVANEERLIELIEEKRAVLIAHAVTRGLNPDVAFRESGVEWLEQIPAHWDIEKCSHVSRVVRGASPRPAGDPQFFNGDFIPWITVGELTKDKSPYLTTTESMLTAEGSANSRAIQAGTVVITNSGATLGVPKILSITGCANDGIVAFERLNRKVDRLFFYYCLSSMTQNLRDRIRQGSGQPNLNTSIIKALAFPLPPLSEQSAIASYLDAKTAKLDQLIEKVKAAIDKLREYRSALITRAVTGDIDVREETSTPA